MQVHRCKKSSNAITTSSYYNLRTTTTNYFCTAYNLSMSNRIDLFFRLCNNNDILKVLIRLWVK